MTVIETVAKAMCEADGFKWDAADCMETGNGEDPEDQREYWRDKAAAAISAVADCIDAIVEDRVKMKKKQGNDYIAGTASWLRGKVLSESEDPR